MDKESDNDFMDDDLFDDDIEEIDHEHEHEDDNKEIDLGKQNSLSLDGLLGEKAFVRPAYKPINSKLEDFTFMQVDIDCDDYRIDYNVLQEKHGYSVIRMYGVNSDGNSICALIDDFYPYFYVKCPNNVTNEKLNEIKEALDKKISSKKGLYNSIIDLHIVNKIDFKNYHSAEERFIKITLKSSKLITPLREAFENGEFSDLKRYGYSFDTKTYESKVALPLRYMIDNGIVGISWVTFPKGKYRVIEGKGCISNCQIELNISYRDVISHKPEGEYAKIAPIRILSFDIEAAAEGGRFPCAKKDPVIQISNHCVEFGKNDNRPIVNNLFSFKKCSSIPGAIIYNFEREEDMLLNWKHFIVKLDPDIIIGYNINYFDFPYLFDRAEQIGVKSFGKMSRIKSTLTKARRVGTSSAKAFNNREIVSINMDGRSLIDMYLLIVKDHKLSSNTLNNVSHHFLGEQKEDVHHTLIYDLWMRDETTRKRLGSYCLKDALLPWKLCEKLMIIYNYAEMCRVTCTPISYILNRGQQIKVFSQIHCKAMMQNFIIPNERIKSSNNSDDIGFEGATVLEPIPAFYKDPIVTLDFASLYPSIMIAHNLCYSTLIRPEDKNKYNKDDYYITPLGHIFMKEHVRKGVLPIILEDLINARKKAKNELKLATDPSLKAVLDGRQLAIKISANSVYGFTGAQVGQLPCLEISASVTSIGRTMIEKTRDFVQRHFVRSKGYENDAVVVYGDTDSVMVKFGTSSLDEAMVLGKSASELISEIFKKPIKIEFEKVYYPYLLMKKKRYAGLIWTKTEKYDKIDMKGLESVRRDNCQLVRDSVDKIINFLLLDEDGVNKAIQYSKNVIGDLLQGKIDLAKLIITKSISKKVDDHVGSASTTKGNVYSQKQAHVELAEKMRKRDEGSAPNIGDRVPYIMVAGAKGTKNYQNSEDPKYVLENDVPIDFNYYLENQMKKPLLRLFEHVVKDAEGKIFVGKHMNVKSQVIAQNNIFSKFIIKKLTCIGCKSPIDNKEALCISCKKNESEIIFNNVIEQNYFERVYVDLWRHCQRCQGTFTEEVICQNYDCQIYYKRLKVRKDLSKVSEKMKRLEF